MSRTTRVEIDDRDAVNCGRPSVWGNPYLIGVHGDRPTVLAKYRTRLDNRPDLVNRARRELRGLRLMCPGCSLDVACHVDILIEYIHAADD
jgi:hypothetical protein